MLSYQQRLDHRFIKISEDIQNDDGQDLDGILEQLAKLQAQATVQRTLVSAAQNLSSHPKDSALPNQLATRVKHIIKFVYEKSSRNEERSVRLRKLECNALKFCGLAYTIRDLLGLLELQFEYLIEYVAEFVQSRGLVRYLYRSDINKSLDHEIVAEDEKLFREFLTANVNSRPLKRPSRGNKGDLPTSTEIDAGASAEPTLSVSQYSQDHMPHRMLDKRPLKRRREEVIDPSASAEPILIASTELLVSQHPPSQISPEWSLTGDVFKLTIEDVKEVAQSDQVGSDIFLTWPLYLKTAPFITIPVSNRIALHFSWKRHSLQ